MIDGYSAHSLEVAVALVNSGGRTLVTSPGDHVTTGDASTATDLVRLAEQLRTVFEAADVDAAAALVEALMSEYQVAPQLIKDGEGRWRLHFHSAGAGLAAARGAGCAVALAALISAGQFDRIGICEADNCERVYYDASKNGRKRFCGAACTNRTKTANFRHRARLAKDT